MIWVSLFGDFPPTASRSPPVRSWPGATRSQYGRSLQQRSQPFPVPESSTCPDTEEASQRRSNTSGNVKHRLSIMMRMFFGAGRLNVQCRRCAAATCQRKYLKSRLSLREWRKKHGLSGAWAQRQLLRKVVTDEEVKVAAATCWLTGCWAAAVSSYHFSFSSIRHFNVRWLSCCCSACNHITQQTVDV